MTQQAAVSTKMVRVFMSIYEWDSSGGDSPLSIVNPLGTRYSVKLIGAGRAFEPPLALRTANFEFTESTVDLS